jgi:methyl coenzyme M reductase beta subunit
MALQQNISYKGLNIDNTYIKIVHVDGNKNNIGFNVEYYVSKTAADLDINNENYLFISKMYYFTPDLNSELNMWQQMYNYLKNEIDEFKNSIDC